MTESSNLNTHCPICLAKKRYILRMTCIRCQIQMIRNAEELAFYNLVSSTEPIYTRHILQQDMLALADLIMLDPDFPFIERTEV